MAATAGEDHPWLHRQTMEFTIDNTRQVLRGDETLRMKHIGFNQMQALLETGEIYGVYELHAVPPTTEQSSDMEVIIVLVHPDISKIIEQ